MAALSGVLQRTNAAMHAAEPKAPITVDHLRIFSRGTPARSQNVCRRTPRE